MGTVHLRNLTLTERGSQMKTSRKNSFEMERLSSCETERVVDR